MPPSTFPSKEIAMFKKFILPAVLMVLSLAFAAFAEQPVWPTINGRPVQCNFGFKSIATPTVIINETTKTDLNDYLPIGTLGFEVRAASGSFVIAHEDNVATGTARVGRLVSEGQLYSWNGLAGTFNGSMLGTAASTTIVIDGAWGYGK